ncbi:D-alanyl-D-alanine dipeptidase [Castellaniella ginsengisoli]|uniref:D-alanyl-D-alanine dipeptidase n=2 Tax=Castellaniella ginsengisoli TaxID=546114 RepID=A0ABN1KVP2_9BURK
MRRRLRRPGQAGARMPDLIALTETDGLRIALAYATPDNLAGRPVYAPGARCALRPAAADCLLRAARAARRAGLGLVVYDAYRPAAAQAVFWRMLPDPRYIADASLGSNHTRGVAVDVGLIDAGGAPLDMGTGFDDMRDQSHHDRDDLPPDAQRNRHMLLGIMLQAGFCSIPTEWWHYELPGAQEYALLPESEMVRVVAG